MFSELNTVRSTASALAIAQLYESHVEIKVKNKVQLDFTQLADVPSPAYLMKKSQWADLTIVKEELKNK